MRHRRFNRALWAGNALLIAGVAALGVWAYTYLDLAVWQSWQNRVFDHRPAAPQTPEQPMHVADGAIVGRLVIPRLHVRAMVREGDGDRALSVALGHIPGTAFPGQPGNIGIAGHRDTLFRGLRNVTTNDDITFETVRGNYAYRVESTRIVKPQDVGVLAAGPNRELTLVTCFPFNYVGSAPDRFIVKARLVSEQAAGDDIHEKPVRVSAAVHPAVHPKVAAPARQDNATFDIPEGHSRELVPGKVWVGLTSADADSQTVDGWVWVMPERRTTWFRNLDVRQPVVFSQNGGPRTLVIARVLRSSARGYLVGSPARY